MDGESDSDRKKRASSRPEWRKPEERSLKAVRGIRMGVAGSGPAHSPGRRALVGRCCRERA